MRYKERNNVIKFKVLWAIKLSSGEASRDDIIQFLSDYNRAVVVRMVKQCIQDKLVCLDMHLYYQLTDAGMEYIRMIDGNKTCTAVMQCH